MISTRINKMAELVIHIATGELTVEKIKTAFKARLEDPDHRSGMKVLWDCSRASLSSISADEVWDLAEFNTRRAGIRGLGKSAIVVSKDVDFCVCRMFEFYASGFPWQTAVFWDLENAMRWLDEPG